MNTHNILVLDSHDSLADTMETVGVKVSKGCLNHKSVIHYMIAESGVAQIDRGAFYHYLVWL